eukprot:scaffold72277_cov60-Phaeocystis_antarctica.AAC.1
MYCGCGAAAGRGDGDGDARSLRGNSRCSGAEGSGLTGCLSASSWVARPVKPEAASGRVTAWGTRKKSSSGITPLGRIRRGADEARGMAASAPLRRVWQFASALFGNLLREGIVGCGARRACNDTTHQVKACVR